MFSTWYLIIWFLGNITAGQKSIHPQKTYASSSISKEVLANNLTLGCNTLVLFLYSRLLWSRPQPSRKLFLKKLFCESREKLAYCIWLHCSVWSICTRWAGSIENILVSFHLIETIFEMWNMFIFTGNFCATCYTYKIGLLGLMGREPTRQTSKPGSNSRLDTTVHPLCETFNVMYVVLMCAFKTITLNVQ